MAIAFGSSYAGTGDWTSSSNTSSYSSGSFTPTANALLICAVVWSRATISATPTISGGSLSWSTLQSQNNYVSGVAIGFFWAITGGSPGSMTVTVDFAGENQTGCAGHLFDFTGTHTSTPIVQTKNGATTPGTSVSATLDASLQTGSATIAIAANNNNNTMTERASWTENNDTGYTTPSHRIESQYRLATSETTGSADKTGGGAGVNMGIVVAEIAIAAAAGANAVRLTLLGVG